MKTFAPVVSRVVIAGVLACSLLGGVTVPGAAAKPRDPSTASYDSCAWLESSYQDTLFRERESAKLNDSVLTARYSALSVHQVSLWHSTGCQAKFGSIDDFFF